MSLLLYLLYHCGKASTTAHLHAHNFFHFVQNFHCSLEEYLHDLIGDLTEEERRNLPHQAETLNFSQAALVLQNSSNVYSRKVEYLYNLVYKAHEELLQSSGNKNTTNASRKASVDAAVEEFHSFDPNVEFLLLDDVLPTDEGGKKINLREDNDDEETSRQDTGISFATMGTHTRLSLGMTGITNMERSSAAHSATQHVLRGSLDNGSLRLIDGRCDVGEGGILIMPGAGNSSDSNSRRRSSAAFGSLSPRGDTQQDDNNPINNDVAMADNENDNLAMGGGFNDYDDHDDEGGGFDFAGGGDDDDDDDFDNAQSNYNPAPKQGVSSSKAATDEETKSKDDPWLLLDPHAQSSSASSVKPLRIGRTCKLPPAVSELPSECVTGARTKRRRKLAATTQPILEKKEKIISFLTSETFRARLAAQRKRNSKKFDETSGEDYDLEATLPEVPLTGLFFGNEFLYIAKATARQKNAQKRQEQKLLRTLQQEAAKDDRQGGDDDAGYAPFDFGGGDDDDGDGFGFANDDDDNDNGVGNNGVASMDDMFRNDGDENDANTGMFFALSIFCGAFHF